jgi:hypothetical protein
MRQRYLLVSCLMPKQLRTPVVSDPRAWSKSTVLVAGRRHDRMNPVSLRAPPAPPPSSSDARGLRTGVQALHRLRSR